MKNKLDKHIKNLLETSQNPPTDAWTNIQMHLPPEKKNKRIFPLWMKLSGIAISMLLMLSVGYFWGSNTKKNMEILTQSPELPTYTKGNSAQKPNQNQPINETQQTQSLHNNSTQEAHYVLSTKQNQVSGISKNQLQNFFDKFNSSNANTHQEIFTAETNPSFWDEIPYINANNLEIQSDLSLENKEKQPLDLAFSTVEIPTPTTDYSEIKKKKTFDRYHLSAFASPISFNTFVGKSMLNEEFNDFPTENNVTISYGVKGAYSLSNKLRIRTGISMVGLEQMTSEVPLAISIEGKNEPSADLKNSNIKYAGNIRIQNPQTSTLLTSELQSKTESGRLQQQAQYVEIPLEAEYNFLKTSSIGISLTGGASTWLLSKNKLYVYTHNTVQELGKAENLNDVSFSANAGLKFDMSLFEKVKLNVEPNFKYLINPVNDIKRYNPYTLGVNAGITVSFK